MEPQRAADAEDLHERRRWGSSGPAVLLHLGGAAAALAAVFFTIWFHTLNPGLRGIFSGLLGHWELMDGAMDWRGLAAGVAMAGFCGVIGWFLLECFEVYIPRSAAAALALILGCGAVGFALELLSIPHWLYRRQMAAALGEVLIVIAAGAWLRGRAATETGLGGEPGAAEQAMRRKLAEAARWRAIRKPQGMFENIFRAAALALIGAITFFIFWHALLYPEVYWDSLILYLGYARMTFLEHGFHTKVVGQVGIGLGANYPHLYAVLGAGAAVASGEWSELPQRLLAPLCGVASTALVYHSALRLTRHVNGALAIALLYRSIPLGIAYDQYASDYAPAMLFAAAFLYLALRGIETGLSGYLHLAALLIAFAMHLNYLMGILWAPWGLALVLSQTGWGANAEGEPGAPWTARGRTGFWRTAASPALWLTLIASGAIGSTWHVRNLVVTGNPVYAFFYKQLGGHYINPVVMEAAEEEWRDNGAGIGGFAYQLSKRLNDAGGRPDGLPLALRLANPVRDDWKSRLGLLPEYLTGSMTWRQGYQLMPIAAGFSLAGFIVWLGRWLASPTVRLRPPRAKAGVRFGGVVVLLAIALLAFHVFLAPFYLYQIIKILPCLALTAALAWPLWQRAPWRWVLGSLALACGAAPGLAFAMMGFKVPGNPQLGPGQGGDGASLHVLRHPMPSADRFYQWRYGEDAAMWRYINEHLKGERLLTHENRHLVFDPSIELVHLDDWEVQELWRVEDPGERVARLIGMGIQNYLYIPNEDAAPSNKILGAKEWEAAGLAELVFKTDNPPDRLYRLKRPAISPPPVPPSGPTPTPIGN